MIILARACALLSLSLAVALLPLGRAFAAETGGSQQPPEQPQGGDQGEKKKEAEPQRPKEPPKPASEKELDTQISSTKKFFSDNGLTGYGTTDPKQFPLTEQVLAAAGLPTTLVDGSKMAGAFGIVSPEGKLVGVQLMGRGEDGSVTADKATVLANEDLQTAFKLAQNDSLQVEMTQEKLARDQTAKEPATPDPSGTSNGKADQAATMAQKYNELGDEGKRAVTMGIQNEPTGTTDISEKITSNSRPALSNASGIAPPSSTTSDGTNSPGGPAVANGAPVTEQTRRGSTQEIVAATEKLHAAIADGGYKYTQTDPKATVYGAMQNIENGGVSSLNDLISVDRQSRLAYTNRPDDGAAARADFTAKNPTFDSLITDSKTGAFGSTYRQVIATAPNDPDSNEIKSNRR